MQTADGYDQKGVTSQLSQQSCLVTLPAVVYHLEKTPRAFAQVPTVLNTRQGHVR